MIDDPYYRNEGVIWSKADKTEDNKKKKKNKKLEIRNKNKIRKGKSKSQSEARGSVAVDEPSIIFFTIRYFVTKSLVKKKKSSFFWLREEPRIREG